MQLASQVFRVNSITKTKRPSVTRPGQQMMDIKRFEHLHEVVNTNNVIGRAV